MFATELTEVIQKFVFKNHFKGIYSSDQLPKSLKNLQFIIVNTDVSSGPGIHWYCVVRLKNLVEVFDSLGVSSDSQKEYITSHFNFKGVTHITFNSTQLQPLTSSYCGEYVLMYLYERYFNLDLLFDDLLNEIFRNSTGQNDEVVLKFKRNIINKRQAS